MRENRRHWGAGLALLLALAIALGLGCRKELPELFDRNQPPETYITSAPVESLFDGYQVHLNWYGRDPDGEIAYYLWAWTDSSRAYYNAWNPETRSMDRVLRECDFECTHLTTKTDSIFFLQANDNGGTSRDLTFNVTAVDDKGRRDPVPARLYFTASVDSRPEILWLTQPPPGEIPPGTWVSTEPETIPVGEPFSCGFTGSTENAFILGYQWAYGEDPLFWPRNENGDPVWTYQDPEGEWGDTITLFFDNDVAGQSPEMEQYYRTGKFLVKARCIDLAGVESLIDTDLDELEGVVAPVLNRDPDTRLRPHEGNDFPLVVTYTAEEGEPQETINLNVRKLEPHEHPGLPIGYHYEVEDTIPWGQNTWLTVNLQGWDMDNPVNIHPDSIETRFQIDYTWTNLNLTNFQPIVADSRERYPPSSSEEAIGFPEELDLPFDHWGPAGQHYRMNILCADYTVRGFALDHYRRVDGTPLTVRFTGGFASLVDSVVLTSLDATQEIEILHREEPVNIKLQALLSAPPGFIRFLWDEDTNTATINPIEVVGTPPYDSLATCEYDLLFRVYGHDDARNGVAALLGRIWWDILDEDYTNSTLQFVPNRYWLEEGGFLLSWEPLWEEGEEPLAEGVFTYRLRIRELYDTMQEEGPPPPWLGEKDVRVRFVNTMQSQRFEELIEETPQREFQLVNIGRMSAEVGFELNIEYTPQPTN